MGKKLLRILWNVMGAVGVLAVITAVPFAVSHSGTLGTFFSSLALIESQSLYKEEVSGDAMIMGAAEGMIGALQDPYSYYLTPEEWLEQQEQINAEFAGIGVYMSAMEDGSIVLMAPIRNTPAEKAGLQSGDVVLSVDGHLLDGMSLDEVSNLIRGEEGTEVSLTIQRQGEMTLRDFTLTRALVDIPSVDSRMLDEQAGIGYVYLNMFHSKSPDEMKEQIEALAGQGAESLILDLRDNGGGDYNAALKIADYFLDDKDIVQIADAHGVLYIEHSNPGANDMPLVLLVNGHTASASEVLSSALRDNGRAQIVGQQTFGKGIIQVLFPLNDGGALKLTTNQYLNLKGEEIHKIGLTPDEIVEESENLEEDFPLQKAVEMLINQQ